MEEARACVTDKGDIIECNVVGLDRWCHSNIEFSKWNPCIELGSKV